MVPREALSRWENAFRDLLSPKVLPGCQSFPALSKTETVSQLQSLEVNISEDITYQAIFNQKSGKAAGPDGRSL